MKLCYEMSNKLVNLLLVSVIPTIVPGNRMKQILGAMSRHMREMPGNSQHGLTKGRSYLSRLVVFFDEMTISENKRRL